MPSLHSTYNLLSIDRSGECAKRRYGFIATLAEQSGAARAKSNSTIERVDMKRIEKREGRGKEQIISDLIQFERVKGPPRGLSLRGEREGRDGEEEEGISGTIIMIAKTEQSRTKRVLRATNDS